MKTVKQKLMKAKWLKLKDGKVKGNQVKKLVKTKISPPKKKAPFKSNLKRHLVLAPADETECIATYFSHKYIKSPIKDMLLPCSFETTKHSTNIDTLTARPKSSVHSSVHVIDYKIPKVEDDFQISEIGSSDLGSEVETSSEEEYEEPAFVKQKVGEFQQYQIPTGVIIILYANSKVFIHGLMRLSVLLGSVDIHGKWLDKNTGPAMVYSPRGSAYLTIENLNASNSVRREDRNVLRKHLIQLGLDEGVSRDITVFKLKPTTAVFYCECISDKATDFLEVNLVQKIYPKFLNGMRCIFKNVTSQDWNMLQISEEWPQLMKLLGTDNKMVLSGGKGVGKSTLLRYLVNQMLNTRKEVYVVDLDPGQPEFTVPGAISLVKVTSPLLGPNYTHIQETEKTFFISNINVTIDHEEYLDSIKELVNFIPDKVPILVNYMGFTRGISLYLTAKVLSLLQADIVVQIESNNNARNFSVDLIPEDMRFQLSRCGDGTVIKDYRLIKIDSVANGNHFQGKQANQTNVGWELEPRQVREMCILSYMSRILRSNCKFLTEKDVPIYRTSLDEINVLNNGIVCDLSAANANIVALCAKDKRTCFGWGIVRGICRQSNSLLLITPVQQKHLDDVRNLIVGSVTLPPTIYLRHHDAIRGHVPYTFKGELSNFAQTPKRNMVYKDRKSLS